MKLHQTHLNTRLSLIALSVLSALSVCVSAEESADPQRVDTISISGNPNAALPQARAQTVQQTDARTIAETVNVLDTEDALKYMPSLFVRKRNAGDTQPVLATRTWGVNSSARSLVYADGVLLTALVANNNTIGAPRWGMIAPEEIDRIDVMYGPFSAAYAGNSMGAVVDIKTRLPEQFEASINQTLASQSFSQYGVSDHYLTSQTAFHLGHKLGDLAIRVDANHQDSHSQPLSYLTAASQPTGSTGGYADVNKLGQVANVYGASGLLHTRMDTVKAAFDYLLAPGTHLAYTLGYWHNDADAGTQSFLQSKTTGQPTYANVAGFASGTYGLDQQHVMHSASLSHNGTSDLAWELVATSYDMKHDRQTSPSAVVTGTTQFQPAGKVAAYDGTGWQTADGKVVWKLSPAHELSAGVHTDRYTLKNPTYTNASWQDGQPSTLFSNGEGRTVTSALWIQDAWRIQPGLRAVMGLREEWWRAENGVNASTSSAGKLTSVNQPGVDAAHASPKLALEWSLSPGTQLTASFGRAWRFPTVGELYQLVSTGTTFTAPNPNLKPEAVTAAELAWRYQSDDASLRVSLFDESVRDALISQTATLVPGSSQTYSYVMNVDKTHTQGVEVAFERQHLIWQAFSLSGSVTWADARTVSDPSWAGTTTVVDKRLPYVPTWRATLLGSWRFNENTTGSLGIRYSGQQYSTLDNTDVANGVFGGFDSFLVADAHVQYKLDKHWSGTAGVDNLANRKFILYHPFPQRTVFGSVKYGF
ncbi:TonB-dependent receptor [Burkholderiaceae bacterium DAT-1]|nr:TonB-dependent receptor [Burkholderiaceae bacterium DAT-1]